MSEIRFNVVIGKGGVGRTLVSILNGIRASRNGKKTLICELNTDESIARYLDCEKSNGDIVSISQNLSMVNIRPHLALMEYADMKLRVPKVSKLVFDNPVVTALTSFVPGMDELLMLGKAFNHQREVDAQGNPKWDLIIVDAPATGHGITLLGLPSVIADAVPSGNMHEEALLMQSLLQNPDKTAVHVVTTPEPLPVQETIELCAQLRDVLKLPLEQLWVNCVPQTQLSNLSYELLGTISSESHSALKWIFDEEQFARNCRTLLNQLKSLNLPTWELPEIAALSHEGLTETHLQKLLGQCVQ